MSNIITRAERLARKGCSDCGKPVRVSTAQVALPSNWQMFKNLVSAAADAVKGGLDVRGPEEVEAILKICAGCPKLIHDERGLRCGSCGCWIGGFHPDGSHNLGKVSLRAWRCPEGKW